MIRLCPKTVRRSTAPPCQPHSRHRKTPWVLEPGARSSRLGEAAGWFPDVHGTGRSRLGARADRRAREVWGERILQPQWRRRGRGGQHGQRPATRRTRQRRPQGQLDRGRRDRDPGPGGGRDRREPGCPPACVAGRRGSWRTCTTSNRCLVPTGGCPRPASCALLVEPGVVSDAGPARRDHGRDGPDQPTGTRKEQGTTREVRQPGESIPIASLLNPRDLGGWATRDGGRVRTGLVFGSGEGI